MSVHRAEIIWLHDGGDFAANRYSRAHAWHFDGGATVSASSSPAVVPIPLSDPALVDPEEAFVAALASCHMLWFLALAAKHRWSVESYRDAAEGVLGPVDGATRFVRVTLRPDVRFGEGQRPDEAQQHALHEAAHCACYLANSVNFPVICAPVIGT